MMWTFQLRHLLLAKELWGFVDGSVVEREVLTAQEKADHKKKSQKALSAIVMVINILSFILSLLATVLSWPGML